MKKLFYLIITIFLFGCTIQQPAPRVKPQHTSNSFINSLQLNLNAPERIFSYQGGLEEVVLWVQSTDSYETRNTITRTARSYRCVIISIWNERNGQNIYDAIFQIDNVLYFISYNSDSHNIYIKFNP